MARSSDLKTNAHIIQTLGQKAPLHWVMLVVRDWAVIAGAFMIAAHFGSVISYGLCLAVVANRQHALALLGHDGTHFAIHKKKKFNDLVSDIFSFGMLGLTTSGYRNIHFKHHQHLNTEHDPELMHRSMKAPQWDLPITVLKVLRFAALDLVGYSISDYIMIVQGAKPDSKSSYVLLAAMHVLFLSCTFYFNVPWIAAIWYGSLVTAFMMLFRLRTWLEHQGSEGTHRLKLNWIEGLLLAPHDSWHHYEHHDYPSVPLHRLHLVRRHLNSDPVITLSELIVHYAEIRFIKSGTPLKEVKV